MDVPDELEQAWLALGAADDALQAVVAARRLAGRLAAWEADLITSASAGGQSWEAIGRVLGLSRQAAWERYRRAAPPVDHELGPVRERQRQELEEARRLRRAARGATGEERTALAAEAEAKRAAALRMLDDTRGTPG